jgi:hypothetical protein
MRKRSACKSPKLQTPQERGMDYVHPFTSATYRKIDGATVSVVLGGKEGRFSWDGRWLSGELRQADPNMCIFIAGGYGGKAATER